MSLKNLLKDSDVFGHLAHKGKGLKETSKKTFAETNQRTNCYPEKKADIPATSRTQRFHANDVSLPRYGQFFWLVQANFPRSATNQKHCPYLSGGMSSVWNFCARSSAARTPFRGETSGADVAKCRLFSQANKEQNHKQRKAREHQEDIRGIIVKKRFTNHFCPEVEFSCNQGDELWAREGKKVHHLVDASKEFISSEVKLSKGRRRFLTFWRNLKLFS